ncbi:transcriptional regulator [Planotetraspora thailandica]|uniref:Transcriptional regulator n=1 Tax=Planotetraspora thailandica TaxID=487172 RepID=A0A8J3UZF0_9ACTN|nr:helix-turn-helix transcriptional regulator [Planotetraspora thailandica]GII52662.1 transcriptional regulator [Planotetraspora thailandica]
MSGNPLGEFLRARRQLTVPGQVGLVDCGVRRRTPGLRREEVATLAGVSTDYYVRLEQGRERNPSDQVLEALARVLQLEPAAVEHLHNLVCSRAHKNTAAQIDRLSPEIAQFLHGLDHVVAFVVNRRFDVLAMNPLAAAQFRGLEGSDNLMRLHFLSPDGREFYREWEKEARSKVAQLRAAAGPVCDDPSVLDLIEELRNGSEDFRRLWARHDVLIKAHESKELHHRVVGDLTLWSESFTINSAPGLQLIIGQAQPGSPSAAALARLAALAAADM